MDSLGDMLDAFGEGGADTLLSILGVSDIVWRSFSPDKLEHVVFAFGYGSAFSRNPDSEIDPSLRMDMIVIYDDIERFYNSLCGPSGFGWNQEFAQRFANRTKGKLTYFLLPSLPVKVKIGVMSIDRLLHEIDTGESDYMRMRLRNPIYVLHDDHQRMPEIEKAIDDVKKDYVGYAFSMSRGQTSLREILINYLGASYLFEGYRFEWPKAEKNLDVKNEDFRYRDALLECMGRHIVDYLQTNRIKAEIKGRTYEPQEISIDLFNPKTWEDITEHDIKFDLPGEKTFLDKSLYFRGAISLDPRLVLKLNMAHYAQQIHNMWYARFSPEYSWIEGVKYVGRKVVNIFRNIVPS
ncbi:hypothetical protein JXC34_01745 [Candidatus Woesearchaeota archaeon]|nr:hypothetical protein [Candidatus Woesearchaeota archaeon]